jgi:SAM-dependent methyltransferase
MRLAFSVAVLAACAPPVAAPPDPPPPVREEPATPPPPQLPPGVLAEAQGVHGRVRVEERDDLRLLLVGDVVQGAVPLLGAPLTGDPLVALVRAARPTAKRVLVIGLGTGRTAAELAAHGFDVEAVDVEPAVIEFARKHFDYTGHAAVAEGFAHARGRAGGYDVILVDSLVQDPPQVLAELYDRLAIDPMKHAVLLAVRLRGSPGDPAFLAAARRTRYLQLWGAGAGDETQTMYALVSPRPSNILAPSHIPAWPIPTRYEAHERPTVTAVADAPTARRVALLGYLIRAREDGALCLDLPHQEMGALRYRLHGPALVQLDPLLPKKFEAMTAGDISLDGDTSKTLREALGGGGLQRSDVRFSPVVVALTGVARVAAVIDPDAAPFVPPSLRGAAQTDPRLPYGGILYDLDVETVAWALDHTVWHKLRPRLTDSARKAAAALGRGDFPATLKALTAYLGVLDGALADHAPRFAVYVDIRRIRDAIAAADRSAPANTDALARGQRCAVMFDAGVFTDGGHNPDIELLARAAETCKNRLGPKSPPEP